MVTNHTKVAPYACYPILTDPNVLGCYARELHLSDLDEALSALARAIAISPNWAEMPRSTLVIRFHPHPVLAILGWFNEISAAELVAQAQGLNCACAHLRYVNYSRAEEDCRQLAEQLVERFGHDELRGFRFTAIPRGGHMVLAMLAYALGLERSQLEPPHPFDVPLVAIDDCAITGARLGRFLERCESQQVIFAHLYSHPSLRCAIESREPKVRACVSVRDLQDHAPERLGQEYNAWQERWMARLEGTRYWSGLPDHVCFAWNEPNRLVWNPVAERIEAGWRIVPPELCLKNRPAPGIKPIPVQVQPKGQGPLKPRDHVIFGEFEGQILVGDLKTGETFGLEGVAADMWWAIVAYGNMEHVTAALVREYKVDEATLRADLRAFVEDLMTQNLLEESDASIPHP